MMDGQTLSKIYGEIEDALWRRPVDVKTDLTMAGFRGACKIFMDALMDKMWERQEKEDMTMDVRMEQVTYFGESMRALIRAATDIDPCDFYKHENRK